MPVNRNALIRYKTIDKCLQNRYRRWTLEDLIEACSEALYEYEGIDKGVSKRTVQSDIQMMRSDKLGYNAPIIVLEKKYYTYEDPDYSITNIPLSEQDLNMLTEAVAFMKQFQGFSHFRNLDGMVQKLEDHIYSQKTHTRPVIDFEKNEDLKGLEFLDPLYRAIIRKDVVQLSYQAFSRRQPIDFPFHPYLLKEYRNRWFVLGIKERKGRVFTLALDRIKALKLTEIPFVENETLDIDNYFNEIIGVTVDESREAEEIIFKADHRQAPYIKTKPFHSSQKVIAHDRFGVTFSIQIQLNFEAEREFLGFGPGIKILSPERFKRRINQKFRDAYDLYETELYEKKLRIIQNKFPRKGTEVFGPVFTQREIHLISRFLERELIQDRKNVYACRQLLNRFPDLHDHLFTENLQKIIYTIDPNAFLTKAIYFDKPLEANWYVTWHQDLAINVKEKVETTGFTNWTFREGIHSVCPPEELRKKHFTIRIHLDTATEENGALKVMPGSHLQYLNDEQIKTITADGLPKVCSVVAGGIHLMHPMILHASPKTKNQKRRRVIHLEFGAEELPGGLEWLER